jgi:hypothetical protein
MNSFKDYLELDEAKGNRTGISIYVAAKHLFDIGYTPKNVEKTLNKLKQPTEGYVYADEVPDFIKIK